MPEHKSKPKLTPEESTPKGDSSLESLPAELVLQIFGEVDHEDIQNFARCCPQIWKIVEEVFEVHKKRRKYYTVRLGSLSDTPGSRNRPIDILRDLVNDDGLAIYPKRLITGTLDILSTGRDRDISGPPFLPEQKKKIRSMVVDSRYVSPDGWYDGIMRDKRPTVITTLLFCLFSNLRIVELRNYAWDFFLKGFVERMVCASRLNRVSLLPGEPGKRKEDNWDPTKPHAPSNLTELSVCHDRGCYQAFSDVVCWTFFPSLRSVRGKGLHSSTAEYVLYPFTIPGHQSEMTSLELEGCTVRTRDIDILLRSTKALKHFKYHHGTPNIPEGWNQIKEFGSEQWNPRGVVEVLSTYASHSLVTLDLTRSAKPQKLSGDELVCRIFVGSLRRFHLLRRSRADIMIFVELSLENLINKYAYTYREDTPEELEMRIIKLGKPLTAQARPLVDLLPASLEELALCLEHRAGKWEVEDLFKEAQLLKAQRLPRLNQIVMEGENEPLLLSDKIVQNWKICGVQIYWQIPFTVS